MEPNGSKFLIGELIKSCIKLRFLIFSQINFSLTIHSSELRLSQFFEVHHALELV